MTQGGCGSLLLHRGGLAPPTLCRSPGALETDPSRPSAAKFAVMQNAALIQRGDRVWFSMRESP